ncbi:MAG: hypothetical protein VXY93_18595, partial [Pseudomonadota bacterium]|nr:hypothetical protein [Pseudomonadota bacterium]
SGNVSIGDNATPDTLLHLQGDKPKLRIESTNALEASAGTEEIGRIEFEAKKGSNINVAASLRVRQDGTWSTVDDWFSPTAIEFYTQDQSGTEITTPRLIINSTGKVGIGTDNPGAILDARGNVQFGDGGGFDMNILGTRHQFSINGDEKVRITSGGNVNIGTGETTQTARMLNVYGGATRVTQTSGGNTVEVFGHTTSGQSYGL